MVSGEFRGEFHPGNFLCYLSIAYDDNHTNLESLRVPKGPLTVEDEMKLSVINMTDKVLAAFDSNGTRSYPQAFRLDCTVRNLTPVCRQTSRTGGTPS